MTRFRLASSVSALAFLAGVTLSSAAAAQDAAPAPDAIGVAIEASVQPDDASATSDGDQIVSSEDLGAISGGAVDIDIKDSALSTQELTATNSNNSIGGAVATGDIRFSEGAFANFNGVGNVVVNTGVQANIQGSINVTINGTSF